MDVRGMAGAHISKWYVTGADIVIGRRRFMP